MQARSKESEGFYESSHVRCLGQEFQVTLYAWDKSQWRYLPLRIIAIYTWTFRNNFCFYDFIGNSSLFVIINRVSRLQSSGFGWKCCLLIRVEATCFRIVTVCSRWPMLTQRVTLSSSLLLAELGLSVDQYTENKPHCFADACFMSCSRGNMQI